MSWNDTYSVGFLAGGVVTLLQLRKAAESRVTWGHNVSSGIPLSNLSCVVVGSLFVTLSFCLFLKFHGYIPAGSDAIFVLLFGLWMAAGLMCHARDYWLYWSRRRRGP